MRPGLSEPSRPSFAAANQMATTLARVTNERAMTRRVTGSTCCRSVQFVRCERVLSVVTVQSSRRHARRRVVSSVMTST